MTLALGKCFKAMLLELGSADPELGSVDPEFWFGLKTFVRTRNWIRSACLGWHSWDSLGFVRRAAVVTVTDHSCSGGV